jgi:MoaA/NifB/PqqE/SkfB family radical SAM enzyme
MSASQGFAEERRPTADGPRKLHVEVTTRCNLSCDMCLRNAWDESGRDMSGETFDALLAQFSPLPSAEAVQFSGFGEPLCHARIVEFVRRATEAGLTTEIVTNGALFTRELGSALVDAGLKRLTVSACGEAGLLPEARRNLSFLRGRPLSAGRGLPQVRLHAVITRSNLQTLLHLRSMAMSIGATEISLSHLLPHTAEMAEQALYGSRLPAARAAPGTPPGAWAPHIILPQVEWSPAESRAIAGLLAGQPHVTVGRTRIDFGHSTCPFVEEERAAIGWRGDLSPCLPLLHTHPVITRNRSRLVRHWHVGNITETPLPELWRSPGYATFRQRVRDFAFPPCPNCGGCEMIGSNEADCYGNPFPVCGDCLYARGLVRCP